MMTLLNVILRFESSTQNENRSQHFAYIEFKITRQPFYFVTYFFMTILHTQLSYLISINKKHWMNTTVNVNDFVSHVMCCLLTSVSSLDSFTHANLSFEYKLYAYFRDTFLSLNSLHGESFSKLCDLHTHLLSNTDVIYIYSLWSLFSKYLTHGGKKRETRLFCGSNPPTVYIGLYD